MTDQDRHDALHNALRRMSDLIDMDPQEGTPEAREMDVLGPLVEAYEDLLINWQSSSD